MIDASHFRHHKKEHALPAPFVLIAIKQLGGKLSCLQLCKLLVCCLMLFSALLLAPAALAKASAAIVRFQLTFGITLWRVTINPTT